MLRQPHYRWLLLTGTLALLGRATGLGYLLVSLPVGVLIPTVAAALLLHDVTH